jgi:hypothetical protein
MGKVKCTNRRYITAGIQDNIDEKIQLLLWELIGRLGEERDYLQVFYLSMTRGKNGDLLKLITNKKNRNIQRYIIFPMTNLLKRRFLLLMM